jgi:hypothetical protein
MVPDGSFQYTKLASVGPFFNWGLIELGPDQMKRTKNSRKMHMVWNVQSGTVEAKVHENEFTVHRGGIWQVPRGKHTSIGVLSALPFSYFIPISSSASTQHVGIRSSDVISRFPHLPSALYDGRHFTLHHVSGYGMFRPHSHVTQTHDAQALQRRTAGARASEAKPPATLLPAPADCGARQIILHAV